MQRQFGEGNQGGWRMKRIGRRVMSSLLTVTMAVSLFHIPGAAGVVEAEEIPVRESNVTETTEDTIIVGVEGVECTSAQADILKIINDARWEACTAGNVPDPRNKKRMLTKDDYVEMKLGVKVQKTAVLRAAEGGVCLGHTRPDGSSCFTAGYSYAENLAWKMGLSTSMDGWLSEKSAWVNQDTGMETGHYTSLIDPDHKFAGIATFNPVNDSLTYDWSCTSGEFASTDTEITDLAEAQDHVVIQKMPLLISTVQTMNIDSEALLHIGDQIQTRLLVDFNSYGITSTRSNLVHDAIVYDGVAWSSSDPSVLTVASDGTMNAKTTGSADVTAVIGSGTTNEKSVTRTIIVVPEGVTITEVDDPDMVYTESKKAPVLSKMVTAHLSNGDTVKINAVWDSYKSSDLDTFFKSNEFDVTGKAAGFDVVQRVHVNPANVRRIYTAEENPDPSPDGHDDYLETELLTVDSGNLPGLIYAMVSFDNGWTMIYGAAWNNYGFVEWDEDDLKLFNKREGGDFTIKGTLKVSTDEGQKPYEVLQDIHVNPATVTNVEFTETEVTTDSGVVPEYPTATVSWSNKDVSQEEITWDDAEPTDTDRKYMAREGGDYTLTGSYNGESTTITVHVNPATPVSASIPATEQVKEVPSGTPATLVETATVTWSNGDETTEPITWEEQSHEDYGKIDGGEYTVDGTALGIDVPTVTVTVHPATIKSVEKLTGIETVQKKAPVLPETVHVVWSNGDETDETVDWETVPASSYETPDTDFVVKGKIVDFEGTETAVSIAVHVNERELVSLTWKGEGPDSATSYYSYKKTDLTGTLIATFDNEDTEEIALTPALITGFDADSKESTQTVTISYTESGVTKTLEAEMKLIQRTGIVITKLPDKLEYIEGQQLDITGIEISETLDDGTTRPLSDEDMELVGTIDGIAAPTEFGEQTAEVFLGEHRASFTINVRQKQLTGARVVDLPKQTTYVTTQPFDMTGLVVNAVYDNGTEKQIKVTEDMLRQNMVITEGTDGVNRITDFGEPVDTLTADENKQIYVLYSEKIATAQGPGTQYAIAWFFVDVAQKEVQSIEFQTAPSRTEYPESDVTFDNFSDAVLLVHNNRSYDETVPITEAEISGFDIDTIDDYTVTVTYGGRSLTFEATVRAKQVSEVYALAPDRLEYLEGETMDLTGGGVVVAYDNGTADLFPLDEANAKLEVSFEDGTGLEDALAKGTKTLEVRWDGTLLTTEDGNEISVEVMDKILKSIAWKGGKPATNTSYYAYDEKDLTGTLIVSYENAEPDEVAFTPDMITGFDATSKESTQTVTITYKIANQTKTMTTEMKLVKRSGIEVTKAPAKTTYIEGQLLDPDGIEIGEILDNGEKRPLSAEEADAAEYSGYTTRPTKYGTQKVTVTAGGFSTTFEVTVRKKALDHIILESAPDLLTYVETQPLDPEGISVKAIYDNLDQEEITVTQEMLREGVRVTGSGEAARIDTGTPANTDTIGTHTAYVLYSEEDPVSGGTRYSFVSFDYEVIEKIVQSIEFVTEPSITEYPEDDANFDTFGGIRILAHCNNDYDEIVDITMDLISGFDLDKVGEYEPVITYGGKTLTFTATVREKKATSTVVTPPTKTNYEPGESLDLSGAYIVISYDNGRTEKIPVTENDKDITVTFEGGTKTEGSKQLVITYKGQTLKMEGGKSVTIKVEKKTVKTNYKNEWRNGYWYDRNGVKTSYTMKWKRDKKGWWIVDNTGWYPKNSWQKIDGIWYFFKSSGYMASDEWCRSYYLNKNGSWTYKLTASWHKDGKGWWFGNKSWYAKRQWQLIDGKWYYFNPNGYMAVNQRIGGYWVGADGAWRP